ncbi:MAG: 30S ribosomal protein S3 [Nanoarchaeota archaeon]|nr:30S ribosomal protein S3 [Nanoarchaeota archaeon]
MEENNVVAFKKKEYSVKEYIKTLLEKGKVSKVRIEYTPIGEKIIIATHKPGLVIGRKGEKIDELRRVLKIKFKLENPSIEIEEVLKPELDAQIMADDIALGLERFGPVKFKVIAYRTLQKIMNSGALGAEIVLGGKLPSARAKTWRFSQGYLKKTGESAKLVDRAKARAETKPGTVGVKVAILSPNIHMRDTVKIDDEALARIKLNIAKMQIPEEIKKVKKTRKKKETE